MKTIRCAAWTLTGVLMSGCMFGHHSASRSMAPEHSAGVAESESAGEFQIGDRILLVVEGDTALTDTFTVHTGPAITLPTIGEMARAFAVGRGAVREALTKLQMMRIVEVRHGRGAFVLDARGSP